MIAVDPYFIVSDYPAESKIIGTAREVNNYKSFWCSEKVQSSKLEFELTYGRKPSVALMGLAFKPNIDDLENHQLNILLKSSSKLYVGTYMVRPNIESHPIYKLTDFEEACEKADIIVFLVAHDKFKSLNVKHDKK